MKWQGQWIWLSDDAGVQINQRVLARKEFDLESFDGAWLNITADSSYRLFINGRWINDGPARGFPWRYFYDRIEVGNALRRGRNVIAVTVQHHGEGTFQQMVTRPGLLVQLEVQAGKTRKVIGSDETWKMCVDPGHHQWSPRIACQLPHEEQYDAREAFIGWEFPEFDVSRWPDAKVVASVKDGPWKLNPRDIPLLTTRRVDPVRVVSARKVQPPGLVETINIKRAFYPERVDANMRMFKGAVLTSLESPSAQTVRFLKPTIGIMHAKLFLDGKLVQFKEHKDYPRGTATVRLKKGRNILFGFIETFLHNDELQLVIETEKKVHLKSPVCKSHWSVAGHFEKDNDDWRHLQQSKTIDDLKRWDLLRFFHDPPYAAVVGPDVHGLTLYQKTVSDPVKINLPENLLAENNDLTEIPAQKGDVEIIVDLGKEYNAYLQLELCAPEGVIVDGACAEAMEGDRLQYTWGNRSGFRYTTRAGWQTWTTFRHVGLRYLALTFRNIREPIKIRKISGIFVHHPAEHDGRFHSGDALLNRIWEVGKHTLLCCMEDTFTDCPTYEQTYWVGDGRNEALVCHAAFGQYDIVRRCVNLPADSLKCSDLVESNVPSAWRNILPAWSMLWVQMIWEHYLYTGDLKTLKSVYPAVVKQLSNCQDKYRDAETGLFKIEAWNMFDWTGIDDNHLIVTHNNLFLVGAIQAAIRIAGAMNLKDQQRRWRKWHDDLVERINRFLWSKERSAYIDSIHADGRPSRSVSRPANTLALLYDVAPPARAKKILPIVLAESTEDIVPFGSPFALFFLLEYLAKSDRFDLLTQIIRREWGDMIDKGATTFWEMLGRTRSHCHAWSAAPTYFLSRYALGVHPEAPGFKRVLFSPQILDLPFASGTFPTPSGNIYLKWEKTDSSFVMDIQKPADLAGRLQFPRELKIASLILNGRLIRLSPDQIIDLPKAEKIHLEARRKIAARI